MNLDSVREVIAALSARGLTPKKRWGQNFLIDGNVRRAIVSRVRAQSEERVWEIGPGVGSLTELLLEREVDLVVFEIDHGLVSLLREEFGERENLEIVAGDVLDTWPDRARGGPPPRCIVGNLPYSSASVIVASFIEVGFISDQFLVMVQDEVADRMIAAPGTRTYSAFTVLVQSRLSVTKSMRIQPSSFFPRPEVASALVELRPRADAPDITDPAVLSGVTRAVFHARRKTVLNSVTQAGIVVEGHRRVLTRDDATALLTAAGIDPAVRGETLSVERVVRLANLVAERATELREP
ncbi:MAG: ribosomal RNA small subunit methyltransferase A [Spirochaetes bacterium]|nr:ribosomal RNA small subunit methyltransferase A [Spirochaetota bacterium]